jgi:hypothetical protein
MPIPNTHLPFPTLQLGLGLALLRKRLLVARVQLLPKRLGRLRALQLQSGLVSAGIFPVAPNFTYVGVNSWFSIVNGSRNRRTALTFS